MITESIVVLILILLIAAIYLRCNKRGMAAGVLPLAILPLCLLLGALFADSMPTSVASPRQWRLLLVMIGLLCSGTLFGIIGVHIRKKAARRLYLALCGGFTILLAFVEIIKLVG